MRYELQLAGKGSHLSGNSHNRSLESDSGGTCSAVSTCEWAPREASVCQPTSKNIRASQDEVGLLYAQMAALKSQIRGALKRQRSAPKYVESGRERLGDANLSHQAWKSEVLGICGCRLGEASKVLPVAQQQTAAHRIAVLTARQREIMELVLAGYPNKMIAANLDISQRTVENHRASIMKKTGARSLPALTRLALLATGLRDNGLNDDS